MKSEISLDWRDWVDQHRLHKTKPVYNISKRECEGLMTACVNNPPESADVVDTAAPDRHMTTTQEKQDIKKEGKKGEKQESMANSSSCFVRISPGE